jgi:glycine/D-amino acid oxidase-like deaminating enzyme
MAGSWMGGLYTASDGQADPVKTTTAFARAAERHGAALRTGCVVERIETAGGRVRGLRSERGFVAADTVVLAAGAWTSTLLRRLNLDLPQLSVRSSVLRTAPAQARPLPGTCTPKVGFRQRRDGSFNVAAGGRSDHAIGLDSLRHFGAFWPSLRNNRGLIDLRLDGRLLDDLEAALGGEAATLRRLNADRVLDPPPNRRHLDGALAGFRALFPGFGDLAVEETWAGTIEVTPDALPVLSEAPVLPGLVVATGFSGHGFGMGPITGRLIAELIAEGRSSHDLSAFRFERYAAGDYGPENAL